MALIAALVALTVFLNKALTKGAARYQEPSHPLPYYAEDVAFLNEEDSITLAGTLTLPLRMAYIPPSC